MGDDLDLEDKAETPAGTEKEDKEMTAAFGTCGDDCTSCPRYIATQRQDPQELEKVRELWVRLGLRDPAFPVEEMACRGCFPGRTCAYGDLRSCVRAREIENCGWCDDYPCQRILDVFEKSDELRSRASRVCASPEMDMLTRAFFLKKDYLDRIQQCRRGKI